MIDKIVILFGAPGCGKTTVAKHLSSGKNGTSFMHQEMSRSLREIRNLFLDHLDVDELIKQGLYIPDPVVDTAIHLQLNMCRLYGFKHLVLTGAGRTGNQMTHLLSQFLRDGFGFVHLIHLSISRDTSISRQINERSGRIDDDADPLGRYKLFNSHLGEVLNVAGKFSKSRPERFKLHEVNAENSSESVIDMVSSTIQ